MHGHHRRSKFSALTLLTIMACALLALTPVSPAVAGEAPPPDPTVVRADNRSLVLSWRAPSFSTHRARGQDGRLQTIVEAPGWSNSGVPGEPLLPSASVVAVAPPTGEITVETASSSPRRVSLAFPPKRESAPQIPEEYRQPGMEPPSWEPRERSPDETVTVEELGWMRAHRLIQVTFSPLRYNASGRALEVVDDVEVRLTFTEPPEEGSGPSSATTRVDESDPFVSLLQRTVVNPEQLDAFAQKEETTVSAAASTLSQAADAPSRYKILVEEEGIYALTYGALDGADVPLPSEPPAGLALWHSGQPVAYQWEDGDESGTFNAGDRILFYARPRRSRWVDYDVYWLIPEGTGTLMDTRSGDPAAGEPGTLWATAERGENKTYVSQFRSERDGDHWYWQLISAAYPILSEDNVTAFEDTVTLLEPDVDGGEATVSVYLQGVPISNDLVPDHQLAAHLNEYQLSDITWNDQTDDQTYYTATLNTSASTLLAGPNQLRLVPSRDGSPFGIDKMWLDAIEVRYPIAGVEGQPARVEGEAGRNAYALGGFDGSVRLYDVSDPLAPKTVTGVTQEANSISFADSDEGTSTYYVLTDDRIMTPASIQPEQVLPEPSGAPDYLIISHSDFISALDPLIEHRETENGLAVHTAPVEAVYDAFGDGRVDPAAIKNYVTHAYKEWSTVYLLLVGDGTHDPLNNLGNADPLQTFIPPYLALVDPTWREAPSDNLYATAQDGDDQVPDLYVGRLPVNTSAEAETVVAKILAYEQDPPPWNAPLLFFADTPEEYGTDFHDHSDDMYDHVLSLGLSYRAERMYYCDGNEGCMKTETYQLSDTEKMRQRILDELNWGALLATWTGHSSWHQWGAARLFHVDDVPKLDNGEGLSVFLQMTCFTSYFSHPDRETLDEALLRLPDGGAVATWGPTSLGLTSGHVRLHNGFVNAIWGEEPTQIGPATVEARLALDGQFLSLWDTYALFGDPAMTIQMDPGHTVYLPLVVRNTN